METTLILAVLILALACMLWYYLRQQFSRFEKQKDDQTMLEWVKTTQQDLKDLRQTMADSMSKSDQRITTSLQQHTKEIHDRLTRAAEVIGELKREAGAFSEVSRSMKDLQEFLRSPKLRGNIGEQVLKDLIGQLFPKQSFHIQYKFRSGNTVDAAIKTDAGILPIDSKFPMENFQRMMKLETEKEREVARKEFVRDVKKHIDAIADKYILPDEGTMDFALMYVPSESVFYEIVNDLSIVEYAKTRRVYIVSPTTLYMHLQTILLSNEGKKIATKSKEVFRLLKAAQQDYKKVGDQLDKLNKHMTNAYNTLSTVSSSYNTLGGKLDTSALLEERPIAQLPPVEE
ncbi:MAG TPA: DNA recombination protein RmuC [Patescibacteria group bacterium]|nr:DNA recombination protein RmuC [Patescibacteria group bacterium]